MRCCGGMGSCAVLYDPLRMRCVGGRTILQVAFAGGGEGSEGVRERWDVQRHGLDGVSTLCVISYCLRPRAVHLTHKLQLPRQRVHSCIGNEFVAPHVCGVVCSVGSKRILRTVSNCDCLRHLLIHHVTHWHHQLHQLVHFPERGQRRGSPTRSNLRWRQQVSTVFFPHDCSRAKPVA
jgi:hypothetical protein